MRCNDFVVLLLICILSLFNNVYFFIYIFAHLHVCTFISLLRGENRLNSLNLCLSYFIDKNTHKRIMYINYRHKYTKNYNSFNATFSNVYKYGENRTVL